MMMIRHILPFGWTEGILSITVEQYLGSLLSIEARHGCNYWNPKKWALARRSLSLLLPMTHVQMHSQNTSAHLSFHHANTIAVELNVIVEKEKHRHEAAAQACRHILPVFSNASLVGFSPQMQNDMEAARTWVKIFAEQDCMSGKVIEALRQLAIPLPPNNNDTNECLQKEIGPCNPIEAEKETHGVQDESVRGLSSFLMRHAND